MSSRLSVYVAHEGLKPVVERLLKPFVPASSGLFGRSNSTTVNLSGDRFVLNSAAQQIAKDLGLGLKITERALTFSINSFKPLSILGLLNASIPSLPSNSEVNLIDDADIDAENFDDEPRLLTIDEKNKLDPVIERARKLGLTDLAYRLEFFRVSGTRIDRDKIFADDLSLQTTLLRMRRFAPLALGSVMESLVRDSIVLDPADARLLNVALGSMPDTLKVLRQYVVLSGERFRLLGQFNLSRVRLNLGSDVNAQLNVGVPAKGNGIDEVLLVARSDFDQASSFAALHDQYVGKTNVALVIYNDTDLAASQFSQASGLEKIIQKLKTVLRMKGASSEVTFSVWDSGSKESVALAPLQHSLYQPVLKSGIDHSGFEALLDDVIVNGTTIYPQTLRALGYRPDLLMNRSHLNEEISLVLAMAKTVGPVKDNIKNILHEVIFNRAFRSPGYQLRLCYILNKEIENFELKHSAEFYQVEALDSKYAPKAPPAHLHHPVGKTIRPNIHDLLAELRFTDDHQKRAHHELSWSESFLSHLDRATEQDYTKFSRFYFESRLMNRLLDDHPEITAQVKLPAHFAEAHPAIIHAGEEATVQVRQLKQKKEYAFRRFVSSYIGDRSFHLQSTPARRHFSSLIQDRNAKAQFDARLKTASFAHPIKYVNQLKLLQIRKI